MPPLSQNTTQTLDGAPPAEHGKALDLPRADAEFAPHMVGNDMEDVMTLIAERDAQSRHYLELRIAHNDLYLDRCYASDFCNETLWKRGTGLVPQWISEKIDRE